MSLYYRFILKQRLYRHHYLVIIICGIFFALSFIFLDLIRNNISKNLFFIYLTTTLRCFTYIIYKYFSMKTIMSYYEILFFQGIIELILASIIIIILIQCEVIYSFQYYWKHIKANIIWYLLFIFLNFSYYSQIFIICGIFSPFYIFIVIFIFYIALFLIAIIFYSIDQSYHPLHFCITIILMVIILFFLVLVFTEVIELNCFGLSYNTKKNIELRAQLDSELNDNEDYNINSDKIILLEEGYNINLEDDMQIELKKNDDNSSIED